MPEASEIHIASITPKDAVSLNLLMLSNNAYFQRFFPKTVAENRTLEDSIKFIATISEAMKQKKQLLYTIKSNAQLIGLVYLKELDWEKKQGEFAYCLDKNFSRKGIVSTALKQLSSMAFNDLNLESLIIITYKENIGSIKVAEKCGFTHIRTLKDEFTPTGESPLDMELYELRT